MKMAEVRGCAYGNVRRQKRLRNDFSYRRLRHFSMYQHGQIVDDPQSPALPPTTQRRYSSSAAVVGLDDNLGRHAGNEARSLRCVASSAGSVMRTV
jgi:hypothetical protein